MNVEARPNSVQLANRINGNTNLTERGRAIHELVLKHSMLKNDKDPKIAFAMSPEFLLKYSSRVEELCIQLGLPKDGKARENSIKGYKGKLKQMGYPHWRLTENKIVT